LGCGALRLCADGAMVRTSVWIECRSAGTTEERIELAVLLAFRWNEMFIVVGCGVAVQSCRGRVVWPRCLAGEEEEEWGDAFAGGWVRWYVPAWLARSLDVAGRRPLGSFRWNGSRSRPAWVRPSRRGGVPAERRSCRLGSSRSHGTTLPGWVGWLAPVGLGWFAGSGGVPQLGQDPDDGALRERDERIPRGAQPGRGVRQERVDVAPRSRIDGRMALPWCESSKPGRSEVAPPQDLESSRKHLRLRAPSGPGGGAWEVRVRCNTRGVSGPSAVALGSIVRVGPDRNGPS